MRSLHPIRQERTIPNNRGFTLLELLVALAVTALLLVVLFGVIQSASDLWKRNTGRAKSFAAARAAFETLTGTLAAATLNTYLDYFDAARATRPDPQVDKSGALSFVPSVYGRQSDLHFVAGNNLVDDQIGGAVFFTVPFDWESAAVNRTGDGKLNGTGFFVRYGPDPGLPSFITNNPNRFRLFQFLQPTESLKVMNESFPGNDWFATDVNSNRFCYVLANNIVAFAVLPKLSDREDPSPSALTTDYSYDTRAAWSSGAQPSSMHQLPPVVRVVMVALDEGSVLRLGAGATAPDLGFDASAVFQEPDQLEADLETISAALTAKNLSYRIFRSDIAIRAARWSND
jgi:uncharacterized protein (TIGR02599 family)